MGGASLTLGIHGYAFGLRLGLQEFFCFALVTYPVLLFQNRSSSPKDISKRYILHWSSASEPLLLVVSHEASLDWEVIAKSVSSLFRLLAMHDLFSGSWSFHLLGDTAEPSPLSPLIDVTTKQNIWTSVYSFIFILTTHNVSTNEGNNRLLWG